MLLKLFFALVATSIGVPGPIGSQPQSPSTPTSNAIFYIGGASESFTNAGDIGAQFNAAYAALPASGGVIKLLPNPTGGCYNFSTEIAATVPGKFVYFQGASTTSSSTIPPYPISGSCLLWTSKKNTTAMVFDYVGTAGSGYANSHGISDITLVNASSDGGTVECQALGGCGSHATGLQIGGSSFGMQNGNLDRVRIMGFGTGIKFVNSGSAISWGMSWNNIYASYNGVGASIPTLEKLSIYGGCFCVNGVGIDIHGGADVYAHGVSVDSNSIAGITAESNATFNGFGIHFENQGVNPLTTHYVVATQASSILLKGGIALDDFATGTSDYFFSTSGASIVIEDLQVYSAGRTLDSSIVVANSPAVGKIALIQDNPKVLPTILSGSSGGIAVIPTGVNQQPQPWLIPAAIQAKFFSVAGNAPLTSKHVVPSPGWGSAAIVTLPEGSTQAFSFWLNSAGSGQKLNPSVTVKFPTAWPTQPFLYLCKLIGGNGNLSPIDGESTSLTKTEMTFVYNDLPVAGKNYKIGCMGQ
jgi:hypothetical protein